MLYGSAYTRSLGVHIGRHHVRAVEMVRLGRWVRCRRAWCLPGDDAGAALAQLASRLRTATLRVVTHLDPVHLRADVREVLVDELEQPGWPERLARDLLPDDVSPAAFRVAHRQFGTDGERARVGVAAAAPRALEARLEQFRGAGLEPAFVGVLPFEAPNAFGFDDTFRARCRHLAVEHGGLCEMVDLQDGTVRRLQRLDPGAMDDFLAASAATGDGAGPAEVWLAPCEPTAPGPGPGGTVVVHPLQGIRGRRPLEPACAVAAGLAVRGLYLETGEQASGSFLDGCTAQALQRSHEQALSRGATLLLAGLILALLLVLTGAEHLFEHRLDQAHAALAPYAGVLTTVEREQRLTEDLRSEVEAAQRRLASRSQSAAVLAQAASLSPVGLQWRGLRLELREADRPFLTIHGLARADTALAAFLRRLEDSEMTTEVQLVIAERARAGAAQDGVPTQPLRRFEIEAVLPAAVAGFRPGAPDS